MILDMGKKSLQILRSAAAALLIGVIVGAIDAVFGRGLLAITDFRTEHFKYLIPFLPVAYLGKRLHKNHILYSHKLKQSL